jgi:hypothetical protein
MLKNIGKSDKLIRIAVAILLLAIVQFLGITGMLSVILMGLSLVFLVTAFINLCPLYLPFGINTCRKVN